MCFGQSPPLLTYIGGPKGEVLHLKGELWVWSYIGQDSIKKLAKKKLVFKVG